MSADHDEPLLDDDAGRLVRPYTATGGRTQPSLNLDRLTLIWSTRKRHAQHLDPELAEVMMLCYEPMSLAEICAHMKLPSGSIRVLVADLIEADAVQTLEPEPYDEGPPMEVLQAVLNGLQRRL